MSLMKSRQPKTYQFDTGDIISSLTAAKLLGYATAANLQKESRRLQVKQEFERIGCSFTPIWIGGRVRFLRSEIDAFLIKTVELAQLNYRPISLAK